VAGDEGVNVTWEMLVGFVTMLAAMASGFAWLARKFDRLTGRIGRIDKKKVSHKTCIERRKECPCVVSFNQKLKGK